MIIVIKLLRYKPISYFTIICNVFFFFIILNFTLIVMRDLFVELRNTKVSEKNVYIIFYLKINKVN